MLHMTPKKNLTTGACSRRCFFFELTVGIIKQGMPQIFIYHARYSDRTENFETAPGHLGHLLYDLGWYGSGAYGVLTNQAPPPELPLLYRASIDSDDMLVIERKEQFERVVSCAREMYAYAFSQKRTPTALKRVNSELFQLSRLFPRDAKLKEVIKRVRPVLDSWFDEYSEYFHAPQSAGDAGIEMNRLPNGSGPHQGRNKRAPWTILLLQGHIEGVMFAGDLERENNDWRHGAVVFDFTALKPHTYNPDEGGGATPTSFDPSPPSPSPKAAAASASTRRISIDDVSSDEEDDEPQDHPLRPAGAPLIPAHWGLRNRDQKMQWIEANWGGDARFEMFGAKKPRR